MFTFLYSAPVTGQDMKTFSVVTVCYNFHMEEGRLVGMKRFRWGGREPIGILL